MVSFKPQHSPWGGQRVTHMRKSEQTATLASICLDFFLIPSCMSAYFPICVPATSASVEMNFLYLFPRRTAGNQSDKSVKKILDGRWQKQTLLRFIRWHCHDLFVLTEEWRKMRKLKPGHVLLSSSVSCFTVFNKKPHCSPLYPVPEGERDTNFWDNVMWYKMIFEYTAW